MCPQTNTIFDQRMAFQETAQNSKEIQEDERKEKSLLTTKMDKENDFLKKSLMMQRKKSVMLNEIYNETVCWVSDCKETF